MRLFDFKANVVRSLPHGNVTTITSTVELAEEVLNSMSGYMQAVDYLVESAMDRDLVENTYFNFELYGDATNNFDEEDVWQFFTLIGAKLVDKLCLDELRFEEPRLRVNNDFVALNYLALKKIMNYKSKINCFNFRVRVAGFEVEMVGG
jgi:hypothetical protein